MAENKSVVSLNELNLAGFCHLYSPSTSVLVAKCGDTLQCQYCSKSTHRCIQATQKEFSRRLQQNHAGENSFAELLSWTTYLHKHVNSGKSQSSTQSRIFQSWNECSVRIEGHPFSISECVSPEITERLTLTTPNGFTHERTCRESSEENVRPNKLISSVTHSCCLFRLLGLITAIVGWVIHVINLM